MQKLTNVGENLVNDIAARYGLSYGAVSHMLVAVNNGGCSMAQFNCPELGGSGQWMQGGMTMVGDMFNYGLKSTVDNLCNELANVLSNNQVFPVIPAGTPGSSQWWPADLGAPFSSGGQNNSRYAVFPNRLAVEINGKVSVYDTLNHSIGGVSQQQSGDSSLTFSSQFGTIAVNSLPLISGSNMDQQVHTNFASDNIQHSNFNETPQPIAQSLMSEPAMPGVSMPEPFNIETVQADVNSALDVLGKLAQLRDAGALTDEEFNTKKTDLLSRI